MRLFQCLREKLSGGVQKCHGIVLQGLTKVRYSAQYISKNFLNFLKIIRSLLLIVLTTLNQILNSFFGWTPPECIKCWWHNGTDMSLNYGNLKVLRRRVVSSRNSNVQIVETDNGQPISFHPTRTPRTKKCKIKLYFFANC